MVIQIKLLHVPSNREFVSDPTQMDDANFSQLKMLLKDDISFIEFRCGGNLTVFKPNVLKECIVTIIELTVPEAPRRFSN